MRGSHTKSSSKKCEHLTKSRTTATAFDTETDIDRPKGYVVNSNLVDISNSSSTIRSRIIPTCINRLHIINYIESYESDKLKLSILSSSIKFKFKYQKNNQLGEHTRKRTSTLTPNESKRQSSPAQQPETLQRPTARPPQKLTHSRVDSRLTAQNVNAAIERVSLAGS